MVRIISAEADFKKRKAYALRFLFYAGKTGGALRRKMVIVNK